MADAQPYLESTVRDQLVKALQALYREQPAKPFTFLSEYFGKLKGTAPAAEKKEQPKKQQKKKKKKVKIEKSDVTIEVTMDTDVEKEWDAIEKDIRKIDLNGVMWPPKAKFALVDFVFGMKKLIVMCQIVNAEVPSTSVITEALKEVVGVGEANMVNIETAADNWGNKPRSKKQGGGKKKKKGKKQEAPKVRTVTPEFIAKDANNISLQAKEASFFVGGCSAMDGSGQTDIVAANMKDLSTSVHKKLPSLGLMVVSAGSSEVMVYVSLPADCAIAAKDWVAAALPGADITDEGNDAYAVKVCDRDNDEFCIKVKDIASASAFGFLRKAGVLEEASEDEFYGADDEEGY